MWGDGIRSYIFSGSDTHLYLSRQSGRNVLPLMLAYDKIRFKIVAFIVLALSLPLLGSLAFALDPSLDVSQYAHTAWQVREGFTQGYIRAIAQTPDGYIWLGTGFGLFRFDGVRVEHWQPPLNGERLPSDFIVCLHVARNGTFWIGTMEGLVSWRDGKLTRYPDLSSLVVASILEDRNGTVWVGTDSMAPPGKLCMIDGTNVHCYGSDGALGNGAKGLYQDSHDVLWVVGSDGVWRWRPGPPRFYHMPFGNSWVQDLGEAGDGTLLIPLQGRLARFGGGKLETQHSYPAPAHNVAGLRLLRDRDGGVWIGTEGAGVVHLHEGRADVFSQADGLSGDLVTSLFEDREGDVWVATLGGLDRFRNYAVTTYAQREGMGTTPGWGSVVAGRDGNIWMGNKDGLRMWNQGNVTIYGRADDYKPPSRNVWSPVRYVADPSLRTGVLVSVFSDNAGRILVSTPSAFGYMENSRFVSIKGVPGGVVSSVAQDNQGVLWIANQDQGLLRLSKDGAVQKIPWASIGHGDGAQSLAADRSTGGLWLGFNRGGVTYFRNGQIKETYGRAEGLGSGKVSALHVEADDTVWAATEGGLSRVKNGRVLTLTSKNGLPCDAIHWIAQDENHSFWLNTTCGLVRIVRSELDGWATDSQRMVKTTVFDSSDGVPNAPIGFHAGSQVTRSSDGKMWFQGLSGGASAIDPQHLVSNKITPPVHIERITANGKTYDASNGIRLPPGIRDLKIDYTALSFVAPEKVQFRYMLQGQDRTWREIANHREVQYSNLPPGDYVFRVTAANNSGVWNETGDTLHFSIAPAYYQTNWFRALCVAAFLGVLWAAYRLRVQQLRRQEKKLRDVIETMPTFAWTALADGYVDFVNRHWEEYTGLSTERTIGSGWEAAVHPEDLERHSDRWRASLASCQPFESEVRFRRGVDGQYRWFVNRAVPLRDGRGKVIKWYGNSTDIEDRKRAERLQADLAHVNRVNTLGELTTSLAHDIKQPIGAAVTNAEACARFLDRDQPDVSEAREAALEMARDAKHAAQIIDRVRSLYRKDSSHLDIVDVNEIIGEMDLLLRSESHRHAVSLRTELADELPKITADRVQLQQVFMNLMLNGIESMRENGGELIIKSQLREDGKLQISVTDNGVGLPPEKADEIFNAFFTTKPHGTGLGLAITRSIVESHGGRVWAAANSERGTTFHFTLPIRTAVPA
jgi:PAS domain S-box-containing protein